MLLLLAIVALVVHPWLGVKRLPAEILRVTDQLVVVALPRRRSRGDFVRVSREGTEWHSFAVATTGTDGGERYCLVIRRGGTRRRSSPVTPNAGSHEPPARATVARPRFHVPRTGAGIGPVLPYLLEASSVQFECLWVGRDHRAAIGDDLVERVLARGDVTLIDSAAGRPDIGALVAERGPHFEAVFVVGNEQVRDGSLSGRDVRNGSLTAKDVRDRSLLARDFKAGQLPAGPQGPKGDTGAHGVQGVQGVPGTARAYAHVKVNLVEFIAARTNNFTSVSHAGAANSGRYCLTPAAGIDPATRPAVVSPDHSHSSGGDLAAYVEQPSFLCAANQFEVLTQKAGANSDDVAFTIIVP